jgi:GT2 family glycosyltransferase
LVSKSDLWWTASINAGLRYLLEHEYDASVLMNDDVTVDCGYMDTLAMAHRQFPDSVIASKIVDENGAVWAVGGDVSWPYRGERHITAMTSSESSSQRVLWSPGMGTLIPTEILTKIGLLDEKNFPQYLSDADYGLRVTKAGYRILVSENSIVRNNTQTTGGVSIKTRMKLEDVRFILFDYRSADYLKARAAFIYRHAPRGLRTISLVTRLAKIAAFSLKRMVR